MNVQQRQGWKLLLMMITSDYLLGPKSRASPNVQQPYSYNIILSIQVGLITDILTSEILPLSYHTVDAEYILFKAEIFCRAEGTILPSGFIGIERFHSLVKIK